MTIAPQVFFADAAAGEAPGRFCIHHPPAGGRPLGLVVHVHAFAEEMNKSRRMAAEQARALAASGWAVLQFDLAGCGDSAGDFGDASWAGWLDDVVWAAGWLTQRHGDADLPLWLWGHRVGCLLAGAAARRLPRCDGLLFWQPTSSGKTALQQFLRLKTAGSMLAGDARTTTADLQRQLAAGDAVEVAGYRLAPALARGLEAAALGAPDCPVVWFEIGGGEPAELSPAATRTIGAWRDAGCDVAAQALAGPAFWQTTEIEECRPLIDATTAALAARLRLATATP